MKSPAITAAATMLLLLATLVPASASGDSIQQFDGIDKLLQESQEAVLNLPDTGHGPANVVELMPAIQKIRAAKDRMVHRCADPTTGDVDAACAAGDLSDAILESGHGDAKDGPSLLDLFMKGSGLNAKDAKHFIEHAGAETKDPALADENLVTGILIGLLREMEHPQLPGKVTAPIKQAIELASQISPNPGAAQKGWDQKKSTGR